MNTFTVSFFGHRIIEHPLYIERQLEMLIYNLLQEKEYVEFLVGRNGDFDQLVSSAVLRCKRIARDDNSALIWVMPYQTAEYRKNKTAFHAYYDEIEVCCISAKDHYKTAFRKRNRNMIDRSDLVVFCVEKKHGGAYQSMRYAKKQRKTIYNLAETITI